MKVSSTRGGSGASPAGGTQGPRNISGLTRGDTFTATVAGVSGSEVFLNLAGGGQIAAKSNNPDALQKGERLTFTVEANENGQVFVKMSKNNEQNLLKIASRALADAGLPPDEQNILIAKTVIEKGLQTDSDKLREAASAMTLSTMTVEKLMFLLEENIEINEDSLKLLNDNILNRNGLTAEISRLIDRTLNLPDGDRATAAALMLQEAKPPAEKSALADSLKRTLFLDILTEKELGSFYRRLYRAVCGLLKGTRESDATKELLTSAKNIKSAIEFQNEIKEYRYYMQIPFMLNEKMGQGDLYVFKDERNSESLTRNAAALLSVDLGIGHVEVFIVKKGRSVECSFGGSDPKLIKLFKDNSFELYKLLAQKGIRLEQADFELADGAFSLLRERPAAGNKPETAKRKYTFDMKA